MKKNSPPKIGSTRLIFANEAQGIKEITRQDDYLSCMNEFNLRCRLPVQNVSLPQYTQFLSENVTNWSAEEKQRITPLLSKFSEVAKSLNLNLPEEIYLVKVSDNVEAGALSTRGNAIFYPDSFYVCDNDNYERLVMHEFFHILTRHNPDLKPKLYSIIGFEECKEITFSKHLQESIIVNPDAPDIKYVIKIKHNGKKEWATPILYTDPSKFDIHDPVPFVSLFKVAIALLEQSKDDKQKFIVKRHKNNLPVLISPHAAQDFFEQIGENTGYIIHPEEILAENFAHMIRQTQNLPNPEVPKKMQHIIKAHFEPS